MCEDGAYTLDRGHMRRPNVNVGRDRLPSDKSGTRTKFSSLLL